MPKKSFYPWLVWFLTALFFFYKYLLQFSPSVMTSELMAAFSVTGAGLGNLAACYFYTYLFMQIPVGVLLDKFSPQKITAGAIFLCALGAFLFSHATSLYGACFSRALIGLGAAFAPIACLKLASVWFPPRRFALIAGLSMTVALTGAVNAGYPLSHLVSWFGWRDALVFLAIPGLVLALLFLVIVRPKKTSPGETIEKTPYSIFEGLKIVLSDKQTWLLSLYSGFAYAPFSVLGGLWGVPFLVAAHHLPRAAAAATVSYMFVGFGVGSPILGWLSDHFGERKPVIYFGTFLALGAVSTIIYLPNIPAFWLSMLMLTLGVGISGFLLCFAMVREVNQLVLAGTAIGFMNMFDSLWEAVSEPFIGKLLDLGWTGQLAENGSRLFSINSYHAALSILPIYYILSLICLYFVHETHGNQLIGEKKAAIPPKVV
ncbi:MAG: MFS transporter [Gammaproteobacteria bacterium]|nr:MFS transporter [Gammaproteobacteria bacterium]